MARESPDERRNLCTNFNRRDYLKLGGASIAALTGLGLSTNPAMAVSEGGPANQEDWKLSFADDFSSGSLDTSKWTVGFGWGLETNASPEHIVHENVNVRDDRLHLKATHDGPDYMAGAVNTKGKAEFGPGSYWEAKLRMPRRVGFLPAFWSKTSRDPPTWPPEIDFVELFQPDGSRDEVTTSHHHIHYSESTEVGDSSTHRDVGASHDAGVDLSSGFHIYGCEWLDDRVAHYVDGVKVAESSDATMVRALSKGAPFYMMLNIHIDRIGTADPSESWGEALVADWVRVWEYAPGSGTPTPDTDPEIHASGATNVGQGSATLHGSLSDLGGASSATVRFEYRREGQRSWTQTDDRSLSEPGSFQTTVSNLEGGAAYEFRAVADARDGDTDASGTSTFTTATPEPTTNSLVIDGSPSPSTLNAYSFSVSGDVEKSARLGSIQASDTVSGSTAQGEVLGGKDGYRFTGEITAFNVGGNPTVEVNGEEIDPASLGDTTLPNTLVIDGSGSPRRRTTYEITVTGDIEKDSVLGSVQVADEITGSTVRGDVVGGTDGYRYSGEVTEIDVRGPAVLRFEDNDG